MHASPAARSRICAAISALLVCGSVLRIIATYSHTGQAFDEPCHVSAGMEFLDKGTYTLDPVHPPLARIAIALPLYLAGGRYPHLSPEDPGSGNYNVVGNHILYDNGHLLRNLSLARSGVLPFFFFGALFVYLWARHAGDDLAALVAVFLYCTTPTILAFSSIAYTDIVAAATQFTAMYAVSRWLESPDWTRTLWLSLALALAFLAKLTTLLFLPAAAFAMALVWFLSRNKAPQPGRFPIRKLAAALFLTAFIVWAGYRFSFRPLHEGTGITASSMPSFQHFPAPLRPMARNLILRDPSLPAPELLHGVGLAWALNSAGSGSYLFGRINSRGWWYFYLVDLGVKLPLPLLLLLVIGVVALAWNERDPRVFLPLSALGAILLITMHVSYQVGVRHILVCIPLIAVVAGQGTAAWLKHARRRSLPLVVIILLLGWQAVESGRAQSDFLAYFNQLAGSDPSRVLVVGCDLDCGQDLFRLADALRARHTPECTLAIWSSADIDRSGLPPHNPPEPAGQFHGCIALSARALRYGDVLHESFAPGYFSWLEKYHPVADVGATIRLYDIP